MATITLMMPDVLEQELQARARSQGRDVASLALDLVEQGLRQEPMAEYAQELTHEQRLKELLEWVESHPRVDVVLDVSRESIYEGRGE